MMGNPCFLRQDPRWRIEHAGPIPVPGRYPGLRLKFIAFPEPEMSQWRG
jgi:hypothetical protein